jgi:chemotaxis methyl-accepting protein methylase
MILPCIVGARCIGGSNAAWASISWEKIGAYIRYLQENPQELDILFKELLIGVTSFFRDPAAWQQLAKRALPDAVRRPARGRRRCGRG